MVQKDHHTSVVCASNSFKDKNTVLAPHSDATLLTLIQSLNEFGRHRLSN